MTALPDRLLAIVSPHAVNCRQPGCLVCPVAHSKVAEILRVFADTAPLRVLFAERFYTPIRRSPK